MAIHLSGNVEGVVRFLEVNGASNISARDDYIEAYVPVLLLPETYRAARRHPHTTDSTSRADPGRVLNPRERSRRARFDILESGRVHGQRHQGGDHRQWIWPIRQPDGYRIAGKCPGQMLPVAGRTLPRTSRTVEAVLTAR